MIYRWANIVLIGVFLGACQNTISPSPDDIEKDVAESPTIPALPIQEVGTTPVRWEPFVQEYQLSGVIRAHERIELRSELSGWLTQLPFREGDRIDKGQLLIQLDDADIRVDIATQEVNLERAENDRNERRMLVSGGEYGSDSLLSPQQLRYIDIASGYNQALQSLASSQHRLTKTRIHAPISGRIADITVKQGQWLNAIEPIAKIMNPATFEAEGLILETIALQLKVGQSISISAIGDPDIRSRARITTINPIVDENGLVKIKAALLTGHHKYFEGMNVTLLIESPTAPMYIIPKEALVLRSGKQVVFTYDTSSHLAKWNYVKVAHQNSHSLAISEGLSPNDLVIFQGQLNLAHDARVKRSSTSDLQ